MPTPGAWRLSLESAISSAFLSNQLTAKVDPETFHVERPSSSKTRNFHVHAYQVGLDRSSSNVAWQTVEARCTFYIRHSIPDTQMSTDVDAVLDDILDWQWWVDNVSGTRATPAPEISLEDTPEEIGEVLTFTVVATAALEA